MIDELRERFRAKFVETAKNRVRLGLEQLGQNQADAVRIELHSLAGEAAMLGFEDIARIARDGESAADRWAKESSVSEQLKCARILRSLTQVVVEMDLPQAEASSVTSTTGGGNKVLIVDDSELVVDRLSSAMRSRDFDTRVATTAEDAVAMVREFVPDAALIDINLPGTTFDELCKSMREASSTANLAVVLVSGLSDTELKALATEYGAKGYASKQLGLDGIVNRVCSILSE